MDKVHIGNIIMAKRKERGLTQEELASYLGVSKPAVSKWESGQSYPDILLLPVLAAFFHISVDELLGYEAQMTKDDVRKLYRRLANDFASKPFEKVYFECSELVKKYHACGNLVFSIAQLLINHAPLAGDRMNDIYREAAVLLANVEKDDADVALGREALALRAFCSLALQQPAEAVDLLEEIEAQPLSTEILLSKAYAMKGDTDRAKGCLQKFMYQTSLSLFSTFIDLMALYADDPEKTDICLHKALAFGDALDLKELQPAQYLTMYLTAASLNILQNRNGRALDILEDYTTLALRKDLFPMKLRGNAFFDRLEPYFESLNLGNGAPRSDRLIRKDIKNIIAENPAFQGLKGEDRYQMLLRRLEHYEEDEKWEN